MVWSLLTSLTSSSVALSLGRLSDLGHCVPAHWFSKCGRGDQHQYHPGWLELQSLGSHPRPTHSETVGMWTLHVILIYAQVCRPLLKPHTSLLSAFRKLRFSPSSFPLHQRFLFLECSFRGPSYGNFSSFSSLLNITDSGESAKLP